MTCEMFISQEPYLHSVSPVLAAHGRQSDRRRSGGRRMHTKARSARVILGVASALQANVARSAVADRKRVGINMGAGSNLQGV
jgi:hypothetical protein